MFPFPNLRLGLASLAIVKPYFLVGTYTDQRSPIRTESHPVDVPLMFPQTRIKLKWRPVVEDQTGIIAARRRPQRSLLPDTHAIDLATMPADFSHRVSTVGRDTVSELFLPIANGYDALAVSIPREIIDAAADDWKLAFGGPFAYAVPDADCAGDITTGDVVARGGEAGNGRGRGVGGVLGRLRGMVDGAKENGFVIL